MKIIQPNDAANAIVSHAGRYGIKSVKIRSTMAQRFLYVGDITVYSHSAEPFVLENVRIPLVTMNSVSSHLRVDIKCVTEYVNAVGNK